MIELPALAAFCALSIWKAPFSFVTQPFRKTESWLICTTFANGTDWLVSSTTLPLKFCAWMPQMRDMQQAKVKSFLIMLTCLSSFFRCTVSHRKSYVLKRAGIMPKFQNIKNQQNTKTRVYKKCKVSLQRCKESLQ